MKFASLLFSIILIFSMFCGCANKVDSNSSSSTPSVTQDTSSTVLSSELASKTEESSSSKTSSIVLKPSSKPIVSKAENTTSGSTVIINGKTFTVTDPNNKRGLSTKRFGYGFGVAKNEKRPELSLDNQKKFDSFKGVTALAVDTKTKEKIMYLTFDNGYEYKNLTGKILDVLKEKKVKAAFFPTLSYLKNNKAFVKRMINEGHIVGNHSATHPDFTTISRKEMANEIQRVDKYLNDNFGYSTTYFRFPTGAYSESSLELVTSVGYKSIFWSVAYADWDTEDQKGKQNAIDTVTSRFHPGAVILLHAISEDNANALGEIIDKAHSMGYRFATLNEYFK